MSLVIGRSDLDALELGARLLGSGGAGDTRLARLLLELELGEAGAITVLDPDELGDDDAVVTVGLAGSVTAFAEKPGHGREFSEAVDAVTREPDAPSGRLVIAGYETAGINAITPLIAAAQTGTAVVDVDGMGRGLSWLDQTTFDALGVPIAPFALVSPNGPGLVMRRVAGADAERFIRQNTVLMGGWSAFGGYRMTGATARRVGVRGSLRRALTLGRAMVGGRRAARPSRELVARLTADIPDLRYLTRGRIEEVSWSHVHGYARGTLVVWAAGPDPHPVRIELSNEFLVVMEHGAVVARVPDLICLVDTRSGVPVLAEQVGAGLEVDVLTLPAPERWRRDGLWRRVNPEIYGLPMAAALSDGGSP